MSVRRKAKHEKRKPFDVFYIAAAAAITLVFPGELKGVREGSIIAAFAVGSIMKVFNRLFDKFAGMRFRNA
jgi:uncharacterized membrane protein YczE